MVETSKSNRQDGGNHIKFDVCSKNIFTSFSRISKLKNY